MPWLGLATALLLPYAASAFSCAQPCWLGRVTGIRTTAPLARLPRGIRAAALGLRAEVKEQVGRVFSDRECGKFADAKFGHPVVRRYREKTAEGTYESWRMWYHGRDIDFDETVMKGPTGTNSQKVSAGFCSSKYTGALTFENLCQAVLGLRSLVMVSAGSR
jgi:hypothetical protein